LAPNPIITSVTWPSSPKQEGQQLKTDITYRNDGTDGDVFSRVIDSNGAILASYTSSVAAGEVSTDSLRFIMPANDITIYAQAGINSTVTSQKGPKTIAHYVEAPPDLRIRNLSYPTTKIDPGTPVNINWETINRGGTLYPQWLQLIDVDTQEELHREDFTLDPDKFRVSSVNLTMPSKTWNLKLEAGYNGTLTASKTLRMSTEAGLPILSLAALSLLAYFVFRK